MEFCFFEAKRRLPVFDSARRWSEKKGVNFHVSVSKSFIIILINPKLEFKFIYIYIYFFLSDLARYELRDS